MNECLIRLKKHFKLPYGATRALALAACMVTASLNAYGNNMKEWQQYLGNNTHAVSGDLDRQDFSDLKAFGEAVKDKRVVLLGEQTHGEENVYALKTRLVKYLHKAHGFDVVVMESGLYDMDYLSRMKAEENKPLAPLKERAMGNMFYMYAESPGTQEMSDYIDRSRYSTSPMTLAGMDSQHTGQLSNQFLLSDLEKALKQSELLNNPFWPTFTALSKKLFEMNREVPSDDEQASYFSLVAAISEHFAKNENLFWQRIVVSIKNQAERYWGRKEDLSRSEIMGENLRWLVEDKFKGRKVIVLGFSGHINHIELMGFNNAGSVLSKSIGDDMYTVLFTGVRGQFYHYGENKNVEISPDTVFGIDSLLDEKTKAVSFTDWSQLSETLVSDSSMMARTIFYNPIGMSPWQKQFDATFFLKTIEPSKR